MSDFTLSYREVIPDQTILDSWKDITLSTGGTQSTLQDIKVAEKANGYCYEDSTRTFTRNRFIYWRINNDVLELVEHSLDVNLSGNRIRYKIVDTPILDGVSIHETAHSVVILVPTVCSVHRLVFPHPNRFHRQDDLLGPHPDLSAHSIFSKATASDAKNPNSFHVFNNPHTANDQLPNLASSYLCPETEEAFFVLAYPSTEMLLIKQTADGQCSSTEMKGESLMPRFLSGLAEKFRPKNSEADNIVSLLIQILDYEMYAVTLCRDGHLKFWSCSKGQCVAVVDILTETGDVSRDLVQGASLRKAVNGDHTLVVFMSFSTGCQFHVLKPVINGQQIRIVRLNTLNAPENDLVDFALQTNRMWSAWRTEDGDSVVYSTSLETNSWTPVILETLPENIQTPILDEEVDPKQVYLQHIFQPGRFPLHIINKALCIYKRSTALADANLSATALKQRICMAVENEIQVVLNEQVVNDQEYIECAQWCWQKFYSCCVQYHAAGLKPLGLLLLPPVSGAVFLKKSTFSFLRPLEPLEHMSLCTDYTAKDQFLDYPLLGDDIDSIEDVISLFEVIVYLEQQMSDIFSATFEKELSTLQPPDIVMAKLLEKIHTEMDSEFSSQVTGMLGQCTDLYKALHKILELLKYENVTISESDKAPSPVHHFSSHLGISMVTESLRQQAQTRFSICRNLLLICNILLDKKELDWGVLEAIRSVCMPEIVVFTQASYVMMWLSGLQGLLNLPNDMSLQRLAPIKLSPVFNLRNNSLQSVSLLEMFVSSSGGDEARRNFSRIKYCEEDLAHWHLSLLPYLNHLRHIIWPIGWPSGGSTVLAEWLLSSGQHLWLQQYVRLLSTWCEWNSCTRNFLLAASFLTSGENYKALELFQTAAKGIFTDKFLEERILKHHQQAESQTKALVNYYLKVIQLFELHKAKDCAIIMANTALSIVDKDDPLMATLYSIKFKHHLSLKHYEMAFDSLNSNPDVERRKDNLRDLVKCLLDEKKLDTLLSFTYGSMEEFYTSILLSRARATDAINNIYYDFLYSYQIKRGGPLCYRLAASVMYEQAYRLSQFNTTEALEKQVKCYLASKNILQLCDPKHAWIVRPSDPDESDEEVVIEPKAGSGTVEDLQILKLKRQVEVVNIGIIKKELVFASAKLKLSRFTSGSSNVTTPSELVSLLNNAGLFKTALKICTTFNVPYESVFETLSKQCVLMTEQENPNAWDWLVENDLQDLPVNRDCVADVVWQLLQECLKNYEEPNMSVLHYVVVKKIINMRMYIPFWLLASYKERNPGELLKLLHRTGRLDEAIDLTLDYLTAATKGPGKEFFGFSTPLTHTSKPFCLPVYAIQNLIAELETQNKMNMEQPYAREYKDLKEVFQLYLITSSRISNELCNKQLLSL